MEWLFPSKNWNYFMEGKAFPSGSTGRRSCSLILVSLRSHQPSPTCFFCNSFNLLFVLYCIISGNHFKTDSSVSLYRRKANPVWSHVEFMWIQHLVYWVSDASWFSLSWLNCFLSCCIHLVGSRLFWILLSAFNVTQAVFWDCYEVELINVVMNAGRIDSSGSISCMLFTLALFIFFTRASLIY